MDPLADVRLLLAYNDDMNRRLIAEAGKLSDAQLDAPGDIGMGTLRKTLLHIVAGEQAWLERLRGNAEAKWLNFAAATPAELLSIARSVVSARDAFLAHLDADRLARVQPYRDSSGTTYTATLREMLWQSIVHSTHHRAQAVHLLKKAGGTFVEVDFMYSRRKPA